MSARFAMKLLFLTLVGAGVAAAQSPLRGPAQSTPKPGQSTEPVFDPNAPYEIVSRARIDIPTIAKSAKGAIVTIVMADDDKPIAQGTGFLVSTDGKIVTNYHVIQTGNVAVVKFPDGTALPVEGVLAIDRVRDLAVIKVHGETFRTLSLGDSNQIQVGEEVVAIGNPLGWELTVSNGIVSGLRSSKEGRLLQTTAPISPGSSGGPLFNMHGQVIGITEMIFQGGENLNFAIPINDAKTLVPDRSANIRALPNEIDPDALNRNTPKVIANERLRAFTQCQMEHNPYDYKLVGYSEECISLIMRDFKEWAIQEGLDRQAQTLALTEVTTYQRKIEQELPGSRYPYEGDWSAWLGRQVVERIEKLNLQPYAVRIVVLKHSATLVDRYVLHFYEVTNP